MKCTRKLASLLLALVMVFALALIFGAATLLYSHCRRRKEDEASS